MEVYYLYIYYKLTLKCFECIGGYGYGSIFNSIHYNYILSNRLPWINSQTEQMFDICLKGKTVDMVSYFIFPYFNVAIPELLIFYSFIRVTN
jgi:hypothetical protein